MLALPLAALAVHPVSAAPSGATIVAPVTVKAVKPLTLTSSGSLNFGTIVVNELTAPRTVSLSPANILICGGSAELVCSGATSVPVYNVRGTNNMVVTIIKTPSTLTNGSGSSLVLTPIGPSSVTMSNSGSQGEDFSIGGSFTLTSSTSPGTYSGVVDVTVDYQ